eukprot:COSAG02_NODE_6284_length_3679_cov_1.991620_4_plen_66_part_00
MANVSLSWAREMPGITSLLMGARNQSQLERNLASLVRHCRTENIVIFVCDETGHSRSTACFIGCC